jgi:hypothetical protein
MRVCGGPAWNDGVWVGPAWNDGAAGLLGAVEGCTDLLETFVDLIGEFPGGVTGLFLKVVEAFTDLFAGL